MEYVLLVAIIFCETGVLVMPFLRGDPLLFAAGALAATGVLDVHLMAVLLVRAAVTGGAFNYTTGKRLEPVVFAQDRRFIKRARLVRTQAFYERHGGKTIVLTRFLSIARTFAPFVAGLAGIQYRRFAADNVLGAFLWMGLFLYGDYFFGALPFVKANFSTVVVAILAISIVPVIAEWVRSRKGHLRAARLS